MELWCAEWCKWCLCVILVLFLLKKYFSRNFDFWKKQNIPYVKPRLLVGSFDLAKQPLHELEIKLYQEYGRIYGRFDGTVPVLSVADPELLKRIFVKDFHIFQNRRDLKFNDPIMDNSLFVLEGEDWKRVRNIVTRTFTSAKLKKLLPLLQECSDVLLENLTQCIRRNGSINCQRMFGAFIMDAIGRCAFGMKIDSLHSTNHPFVVKAKKMLYCFMSWRTILTILFPGLMKLFRVSVLNPETMNFYRNIMLEVVQQRKNANLGNEDFLKLLLDAEREATDSNNNSDRSQGLRPNVKDRDKCQESRETSHNARAGGLSHDELVAQCVTFFLAGYDSTTSLMSHAMYNLATHPECQQKAIAEIDLVMQKNDGNLNHEALNEMKYMDAILTECLRLCPTMVRLERRAEEDCIMQENNIFLEKGMLASIPIYAIHRDPEWYPDPDAFRPERFLDGDSARPPHTFLSFGAGPRVCVGVRFVNLEVKLCLANVLRRFKVLPSPEMAGKLGYNETRGILKVNDVDVRLIDRRV